MLTYALAEYRKAVTSHPHPAQPLEPSCSFFLAHSCLRTFAPALPLPGIFFPDACVADSFLPLHFSLNVTSSERPSLQLCPQFFFRTPPPHPHFPFKVLKTTWNEFIDMRIFAMQEQGASIPHSLLVTAQCLSHTRTSGNIY